MVRTGHRPAATALRVAIDPQAPSPRVIAKTALVLRNGGLVAFPTDTLYALGADVANTFAVQRVFTAKGRSLTHPVPVLVADLAMAIRTVGSLTEAAARLASRYWPGPLTLLLAAPPGISRLLTAGTGRIGLRVPDAPVALALIRKLGGPVTGTSANRSGGEDPRDSDTVLRQLGDRIDLILDGGPVPSGVPSTVVDVSVSPPAIVRQGALREEEVLGVLAGHPQSREGRDRG